MLVSLFCSFVFLVIQIQGSSIHKRFDTGIPSDCKLQPGSNDCVKQYLCGTGDFKTKYIGALFCKQAPSQLKCAVPLVRNQCSKKICPCTDHKGKKYAKGEKYMHGKIQGAGELFECTCNKDSELCGAVCERVERLPVHKPRPPPTFPPFPFPGGGR